MMLRNTEDRWGRNKTSRHVPDHKSFECNANDFELNSKDGEEQMNKY